MFGLLVTFQIPFKLLGGFNLNSCSTPKEVNPHSISLKRNMKTDLSVRTVFLLSSLVYFETNTHIYPVMLLWGDTGLN